MRPSASFRSVGSAWHSPYHNLRPESSCHIYNPVPSPSKRLHSIANCLALASPMIRSVRIAGTHLPLISNGATIANKLRHLSRPPSQLLHCVGSQQQEQQKHIFRAATNHPFELKGSETTAAGRRSSFRTMASNGAKFPAQTQEGQPGREHEMDPAPVHSKDYIPAGKLKGKVAIITGGDSGIGRAVARLFSLEGASVAITYVPDIEEKDADDTLDIIKKAKTADAKDPIKIGVDLGFDENCKKVVDETVKHFGKIDILVNNAAEQYVCPNFEDISPEQVERVFRTNIFSHFFLSRHALKHMEKGSSIISTTSINAYKGNASLIDYTSTKGAIVAFVRGLALHLAPRKIRVNGVAPGPIWTPLIPSSFPEQKVQSFGDEVPMKRAGDPHEVATSYVFLASEDASYFSGQVLHPNGGLPVNA